MDPTFQPIEKQKQHIDLFIQYDSTN